MNVCTVEEMRALDRAAIERYGIPAQILMENAGGAVYSVISTELGVAGRRFVILCGGGHNGGDGLVVARRLASGGGRPVIVLLADPDGFDAAPRLHLEMAEKAGIPMRVRPTAAELRAALVGCDVIVDALLGTGIGREVDGRYREAVEAINASPATVVAVDIPSGVAGDTGKILGAAVRADLTVTFGLPKRGNLLYPGAGLAGSLYVSHISFPPELTAGGDIAVSINIPPPLPPRRPDGHKGTFGDALFIAGAAGYYGAPAFAALSMLRAGGGYSRLAAPGSVVPHVASLAPEVVFAPQPETAEGTLAAGARDGLVELAAQVDFTVLGPGLSLHRDTQELVRALVAGIEGPLLIDGDGLTAVAGALDAVRSRSGATVLTPHPGEMARLCGTSTAEVLAEPVAAVQEIAADLGAIVVLKGAHSLIGHPDGSVLINVSGSSALATAGSGDVLTGTVAAMFGLGLELVDAVAGGVFVHGLAGDLAAADVGADGVTARTVLGFLPAAVASYRERYAELTADCCGAVHVV